MDIRAMMSIGSLTSSLRNQKPPKPCYCSSRPPNSSDNNNNNNNNKDIKANWRIYTYQMKSFLIALLKLFYTSCTDKSSTDWDKAWSSFKKQGKKSLFSQFKPNKYVSWNPTRSNFPLSEEVDPIKRAERHICETITITSIQNTNDIVQVEEVEKNPVRIIPGPTEDEDFNSGSWVSATEYVNANSGIVSGCLGDIKTFLKNGKLEQVIAIIKSCSLNALDDLKVTVKDQDFVPGNGSGVGGSGMLIEEEEIVKLVKEKEMADLELHVCGNVIDQEDLYKFDEEALDLVLEEE
nr:uncharacterized protein [Tanacetum cinerariifolium]